MPPGGFIGAGLLSETYSLNSPFHFTDFLYPYRPAFSGFKSFLHITAFHLCLRAQTPTQKTVIIPVKADVKQFRKFHSLSVHDAGTRQSAGIINFYYSHNHRHRLWFYIQKNIPSRRPLTHICAATVLMRPKFINFFRIRRPANLFYVRGFRTAFTAFEQNGTYNNIPSNSGSRNYQAFIRGKNRPSFKNPLFPRRLSLYAYFPVL